MITYKFKTKEIGIDSKTRTIIKTEKVPATTQDSEFRLEEKEKELENLGQSLSDTQKRIDELEVEISVIKSELEII